MSVHTENTAMMMCTFGVAPSQLVIAPIHRKNSAKQPAANIMDFKPFLNIMPFGMCTSLANPSVAAATTAALGVLTPMPCTPAACSPWIPGSPNVLLANMPALNNTCQCICSFGGVITILMPGQFTEMLP